MYNLYDMILRSPEGEGTGEVVDTTKTPEPKVETTTEPDIDLTADTVPRDVFLRRVGQISTRKAELEAELARAKAQLASAPPKPEVVVEKPAVAQIIDDAMIQDAATKIADKRQFDRRSNEVYQKGVEAHKQDFVKSVETLQATAGGNMPTAFLEAVFETDAPEAVLLELGKNPTEAMRILEMPPARQGAALAKFEIALKAKPAAKVSKAPEPIIPVVDGHQTSNVVDLSDEKISMKDFAAERNKQVRERKRG